MRWSVTAFRVALAACSLLACRPGAQSSVDAGVRARPVEVRPKPRDGEDWPRWRGPRNDGVSGEVALTRDWEAGDLVKAWSFKIGDGFSSPIAVDGVLYMFDQQGDAERLTALDAKTGAVRWSVSDPGGWTTGNPGPRATPAVEGDFIYTYGGNGDLTARRRSTGEPVWRTNAIRLAEDEPPQYGVASSPLVFGDLIFVQAGQKMIAAAIDRATGTKQWWVKTRGGSGAASPVLHRSGDQAEIVVEGGAEAMGLDPKTGLIHWSFKVPTEDTMHAPTPVLAGGGIAFTRSVSAGAVAINVEDFLIAPLWEAKNVHLQLASGIYDDGVLYVNSWGVLTALDWANGHTLWEARDIDLRLGEYGTFVRVGDRMVTLSDRGLLTLLKATRDGVSKLAQVQAEAATGGSNFATPLLYRGRIYVRSESALVAWEPRPDKKPETKVESAGVARLPKGTRLTASDWVRIPGGTFTLGSMDGGSDEQPPTQVTLSRYQMLRTEVSVAQYAACVADGRCSADALDSCGNWSNWARPDRLKHPINCVDWQQAETFCEAAGGRLPTEAEWEFAARGPKGFAFPWGDAMPDDRHALFGQRNHGTAVVDSYPKGASTFALRNMAGNVSEWVQDAFWKYPGKPLTDPTYPGGEKKLIRGGNWSSEPTWLRSAHRYGEVPTFRDYLLGFRCVRPSTQ